MRQDETSKRNKWTNCNSSFLAIFISKAIYSNGYKWTSLWMVACYCQALCTRYIVPHLHLFIGVIQEQNGKVVNVIKIKYTNAISIQEDRERERENGARLPHNDEKALANQKKCD